VSDLCYYDSHGSYLLSCSADKDIRLWRSNSLQCLTIYRSHLSPIWCLAVHSKSDRFASGSMDRTIRLWTPDRHDHQRTLIYHTDDVNTVVFHPNGKYLASGSNDNLILLWSIEQAQPARILQSSAPIEQLTFTSDGNHLISISSHREHHSCTISQWDIRSTSEQRLVENIPSDSRPLKLCQICDTKRFVAGFQQMLVFFNLDHHCEQNGMFRSTLSKQSMERFLHVSSHQSNKLVVAIE
jgi:WD40 repeat protein